MKRVVFLMMILTLLLTGCSLVPNEYASSRPHETEQIVRPEAAEVKSYEELTDAILDIIKLGAEEGSIRAVGYDGNVEEDLVKAVYEVARQTPVGAYAVDYINHSCARIVNYYEIRLSVTYRRSGREIASIQQAYTPEQMQGQVARGLMTYADRLAMQITEDQQYDMAAIVAKYCGENPAHMVEIPQIAVSVYPDSGKERIVEVEFFYEHSPEELDEMKKALEESISAAAEYIRYRNSDRDKMQLLYTYLTERFTYKKAVGTTPVYSALCEGIADPMGLSRALKLICDKAGVACSTVSGLRDGETYHWNIVSDDGDFRHMDLYECIMDSHGLHLKTDWQMDRYYWNTQEYPACVVKEEPVQEEALPTPEPEDTEKEELP